jgi:hypothetical protein
LLSNGRLIVRTIAAHNNLNIVHSRGKLMAVVFKGTSDFSAVVKDQDKLIALNIKLKQQLKEVTDESKRGQQQSESSLAAQTSQITSMVTGWASVQGAVRLVGAALRFTQEESEAAVAGMDKLADSRRRLAQISLTGKDLDRIDKQSDELAAQYGVDRDVARNVVFDATSLGASGALDSIFKYSSVLDPKTATTAAGKLPAIFNGAVDSNQAMALAHSASMDSALSFEDLMQSLPTAAQGVNAAGGTAAEAAALISVLSENVADKSQAGNLMKALGVKVGISRDVFPEKTGVMGAVSQLDAMPVEKRSKFLGESQELNVAYQMVSKNMAKIKEQEAKIQLAIDTAGTAESPLELSRLAVFDETTDTGQRNLANLERQKAAVRRDIVREDRFAVQGAGAEATRDTVLADLDQVGAGMYPKFAAKTVAESGKFIGVSAPTIDRASMLAAEGSEQALRASARFLPLGLGHLADFAPTAAEKVSQLREERAASPDDAALSLRVEQGNGILSEIRDGIMGLIRGQQPTGPVPLNANRETR